MSITIRLEDLMEANRSLIAEFLQKEADVREKQSREETYLSRDKVMQMPGISPITLWRWKIEGYRVPIELGRGRLYRKSDVDKKLHQ